MRGLPGTRRLPGTLGVIEREPALQPTADDFRDRVSSWSELSDLVEHFSFFNGHDWLFRGVTDASHGLVPKIGRKKTRGQKLAPDSDKPVRVPYRPEDERAVLTMFRQQAWAHMATSPENGALLFQQKTEVSSGD